ELRLLALVEHQVEQDPGHPLAREHRLGLFGGAGDLGLVAEVVEVELELDLHRRLVLDHEHARPQYRRRPVHFQAGRQRWRNRLPGAATLHWFPGASRASVARWLRFSKAYFPV